MNGEHHLTGAGPSGKHSAVWQQHVATLSHASSRKQRPRSDSRYENRWQPAPPQPRLNHCGSGWWRLVTHRRYRAVCPRHLPAPATQRISRTTGRS